MTPFHQSLAGWQNFYILTGTAAATLTGLMFVAVTFGSSLVTKATANMARAFLDPTYLHFVQILVTGCLLTIPTMTSSWLGAFLGIVACVRLGGLLWIFRRFKEADRRASDIELSDWMLSIIIPGVCQSLLLATAIGFLMDAPLAVTGLGVVTLGLLVVGIHNAWELLVWMAMTVSERQRAKK